MRSYQEGLPAYWGIETCRTHGSQALHEMNQEGLPAYWGIETNIFGDLALKVIEFNQEGLPAYWGIETQWRPSRRHRRRLSGRITRLLGY